MKLKRVLFLFSLIFLSCQFILAQTTNKNSSIKIEIQGGKYIVSGNVTNENIKKEVIEKIKTQLDGGGNIDFSRIKIDLAVAPFNSDWQKSFDTYLSKIKNWESGVFIFNTNEAAESYPNVPTEILNAEIVLINSEKPIRLADYQYKTVVLFFLASWCGPCILQAEELKKFYSKTLMKDVEIIGVGIDLDEKRDFQEFVRRGNFNYKMGIAGNKLYDAGLKISKFVGIPQTFLIRDEKLYGVFVGASSTVLKKLETKILEISETR